MVAWALNRVPVKPLYNTSIKTFISAYALFVVHIPTCNILLLVASRRGTSLNFFVQVGVFSFEVVSPPGYPMHKICHNCFC